MWTLLSHRVTRAGLVPVRRRPTSPGWSRRQALLLHLHWIPGAHVPHSHLLGHHHHVHSHHVWHHSLALLIPLLEVLLLDPFLFRQPPDNEHFLPVNGLVIHLLHRNTSRFGSPIADKPSTFRLGFSLWHIRSLIREKVPSATNYLHRFDLTEILED